MPGILDNSAFRPIPIERPISKPEADKTFLEKWWTPALQHELLIAGAVLAALALCWLIWRRGWPQAALRAGRPYWREAALFGLLGAILLRMW